MGSVSSSISASRAKTTPKDGQRMSEFGDREDVQQIRVIALVMIPVLLGSANIGSSAYKRKRLNNLV